MCPRISSRKAGCASPMRKEEYQDSVRTRIENFSAGGWRSLVGRSPMGGGSLSSTRGLLLRVVRCGSLARESRRKHRAGDLGRLMGREKREGRAERNRQKGGLEHVRCLSPVDPQKRDGRVRAPSVPAAVSRPADPKGDTLGLTLSLPMLNCLSTIFQQFSILLFAFIFGSGRKQWRQ